MTAMADLKKLQDAMAPLFDEQRQKDAVGYDDAMRRLRSQGADVETIGGNCPVQIEGRIGGKTKFYFRARGGSWQFHVYPAHGKLFDDDLWVHKEDYGEWPDAGWMPQGEALDFCVKAIGLFKEWRAKK